jgi:hypothetical protein
MLQAPCQYFFYFKITFFNFALVLPDRGNECCRLRILGMISFDFAHVTVHKKDSQL